MESIKAWQIASQIRLYHMNTYNEPDQLLVWIFFSNKNKCFFVMRQTIFFLNWRKIKIPSSKSKDTQRMSSTLFYFKKLFFNFIFRFNLRNESKYHSSIQFIFFLFPSFNIDVSNVLSVHKKYIVRRENICGKKELCKTCVCVLTTPIHPFVGRRNVLVVASSDHISKLLQMTSYCAEKKTISLSWFRNGNIVWSPKIVIKFVRAETIRRNHCLSRRRPCICLCSVFTIKLYNSE